MDEARILSRLPLPGEGGKDASGPRGFARIVGQPQAVQRLKAVSELGATRNEPPPHILLIGPDGMGKRTLAQAFAEEVGSQIVAINGTALGRVVDLMGILTNLVANDVLLIDEIHRLPRLVEKLLRTAMEGFAIDFVIDKGLHARTLKYALHPFTGIGIAPRQSAVPPALASLFPIVISLQPYTQEELATLAQALARARGFSLTPSAAMLVAQVAAASPQKLQSVLRLLPASEGSEVPEEDAANVLAQFGFQVVPGGEPTVPTDLTQLSGTEFERLITTLLGRMGFRTELTQVTGDGGIDIKAFLDRPIVGGRYLVQCKRYGPDSLVGAPAIREFYGAFVADRSAVKGLFITTSGFSAQAREFAQNLPIELIDGNQLRALLSDQASSPCSEPS